MGQSSRTVDPVGMKSIVLLAMTLIVLMATGASAFGAESLEVRKLVVDNYPKVDLSLILESEGELDEFTVTQDSEAIQEIIAEKVGEQPISVVMLVDLSGSMRGKPIFEAKKAAKQFAERAGPNDRISIITFSSEVSVIQSFTSDKKALTDSIDSLEVRGETRLHDALAVGLELLITETSERKAMVVLSDGGDTRSNKSGDEVIALARDADIPIYSIVLTSPELDTDVLEEIASVADGRLITDVRPETLADAYARVATEFKSEHLLSFESMVHDGPSNLVVTAKLGEKRLSAKVELVPPDDAIVVPATGPAVFPASQEGLSPIIASPIWLAVAAVLGFVAVVLFVSAVGWKPPKNTLAETMDYYEELKAHEGVGAKSGPFMGIYASLLGITGKVAESRGFMDLFSVKLQQAGLPVKPREYMILHVVVVILTSLIVLVGSGSFAVSMAAILFAVFLPVAVVDLLCRRRLKRLNDQLPDTLSGISGFLRAGYGVSQAIESAGQESPDPIGAELKRVAGATSFGTPLEEAMGQMAQRVGSRQFDWVVTAITINKETGGNLSGIIDQVAASMRQRQAFQRQIKAFSAEGKLSATILVLLPIVMAALMFLISPDYMSLLFTTNMGVMMIITGVTMLVMGTLWMRKVVRIEY